MPVIRALLTTEQYDHIDKLAEAAGVEHGEIIRTLIKLDMDSKDPQLDPRVVDLVGQLYALVVKSDEAIVKTAPTVAHVELRNRKGTILTPEQDAQVLSMRGAGYTWQEIQKHFGVGYGTVFRAHARAVKRR